ncbi:MAG TPA: hypothetical protein VHL57_09555 [Flavobacteriales bacterium]|jgi:hypothetical protein|nr:hypothetical protein [Flavobacteriales bacterium]
MTTERIPPTTPPSREHLLRYLRGELSPAEQHAVERQLEADPLLREAVEGLSAPGALAALGALRAPVSAAPAQWPYRVFGGALVVGVVGLVVWMVRMPQPSPQDVKQLLNTQQEPEVSFAVPNTDSVLRVVHNEIAAVETTPIISHVASPAVPERFQLADTLVLPVVRDTSVHRVQAQPVTVHVAPAQDPPKVHAERPSRQLVFLHDLKLVHPRELYGSHPPMLVPSGVSADRENANAPKPADPVNVSYLDFMDRAMEAFAQGRFSTALDDLYFLLGQYPDDVNAQFYAGLCCYDLGIYPRAQRLLDRAAQNKVDTFNEEATWYSALALEQQQGKSAVQDVFARIAQEGGFYAERAKAKLGQ